MNFKKMIDLIKKKPGVFIWNPDLKALQSYIDGYLMALTINEIEDKFDIQFRKYFSYWLQHTLRNEYKSNRVLYEDLSSNGGRSYLQFIPLIELDSKKQLDIFFKYFDLFYEDYIKGVDFEAIKNLYFKQ